MKQKAKKPSPTSPAVAPKPEGRFLWLCAALALYLPLVLQKIDFTVADLGRHLKNGMLIGSHPELLWTNFYSYTHPLFPFLNHHWGSGVVFFEVWRFFGWDGLSWFFAGLSLATLALVWRQARDVSVRLLFLSTLLLLPLLGERFEIRPEAFSYLFIALYGWALRDATRDPASSRLTKLAWCLPLFQIVWANLHIYFFLGPVLIGIYATASLLRDRQSPLTKQLWILLALAIGASFVNRLGWQGALAPFRIFENYGYRVLENQTIWFLHSRIANATVRYFEWLYLLILLSFGYAAFKKRIHFSEACIFILASGMGWMALRNCALFAFLLIPILPAWWERSWGEGVLRRHRQFVFFSVVLAIVGIFIWNMAGSRFQQKRLLFGSGPVPGSLSAIEFFRQARLSGPVFNNYDIGSALIWGLPETEKVFVDNRPEAYPKAFFEETYIPMQQDESVWKTELAKRNFNVLFFSHRDYTPWGQAFLVSRIGDREWAPVFADAFSIIFLRRTPANAAFIRDHELPPSMFRVTRTS